MDLHQHYTHRKEGKNNGTRKGYEADDRISQSDFDSTFNAMEILQEQTEKMVNSYLEQAHWFPAEGKAGGQ